MEDEDVTEDENKEIRNSLEDLLGGVTGLNEKYENLSESLETGPKEKGNATAKERFSDVTAWVRNGHVQMFDDEVTPSETQSFVAHLGSVLFSFSIFILNNHITKPAWMDYVHLGLRKRCIPKAYREEDFETFTNGYEK